MKSLFLQREQCELAVHFAMPSILHLGKNHTFKRQQLAIVIGNPCLPVSNLSEVEWVKAGGVLYTHEMDKEHAECDFLKIATSKCHESWLHRKPTRYIQQQPHLLKAGDTSYYGSIVYEEIVVACSGVQPYYDEMVAMWVAAACKAIAADRREQYYKTDENGFFT